MAKLVTLIETTEQRGLGRDGDPVRRIRQWWTTEGELVVEVDDWLEDEKAEAAKAKQANCR